MNVKNVTIANIYCEEIFREVCIHIEPNSDDYRGGFVWSICQDENEFDRGLPFTKKDALTEARRTIGNLNLSLA
ncbi:MAG: hypothetical protein V4805_17980 [Pseudomonadota bacterium]